MKLTEFFRSEHDRRSVANLDKAIWNYAVTVAANEFESYTEFEIEKLRIADAFLSAIGQPTSIKSKAEAQAKPSRIKSPRFGFVYLMRNLRNGLVKIGFSTNPKHREGTLQSQEPEIQLLNKWPSTMANELVIHGWFSKKRVRGEWFALDDSDIERIERSFAV